MQILGTGSFWGFGGQDGKETAEYAELTLASVGGFSEIYGIFGIGLTEILGMRVFY